MADFPSDKAIPLDGMIGSFRDRGETDAPATENDRRIHVFMSGDGVSDPGAMGLDEDLRLLVQAFIQGSHSGVRPTSHATSASHAHGDIQIALHGLNLTSQQERELHHLVRELVGKRVAGREAAK